MKHKKIVWGMLLVGLALVGLLGSCGNASPKGTEQCSITIAYQPSIGYAPILVMKDKQLIEKKYGGDITVNWVEMSSGASINEGMISGSIDVGCMGVPVAITGVMSGCPYKIAFGISAQPYSLLTSSESIYSLKDIISTNQIAIVNINSQPHILLAMAAKAELGDAHALDKNLVILGNSDGYAAIISGNVDCHMVISPFNFMELSNTEKEIHEIEISSDVWPADNTALVAVVTEKLKEDNPLVYEAILDAVEEANKYIAENMPDVASLLAENYDANEEEILEWMQDRRSVYASELHGVMDLAAFMVEAGFLNKGPESILDIAYEEVRGE